MARDPREIAAHVAAVVALVLMVVVGFFYLASGLMAPGWAVAVLLLIWVGLFSLGLLWVRRRPLWVLPIPLLAAAVWWGGMYLGGEFLGWTP